MSQAQNWLSTAGCPLELLISDFYRLNKNNQLDLFYADAKITLKSLLLREYHALSIQ